MANWIFLAGSAAGVLLTLNAYRPPRSEALSVFAFFNGWIVSEMPLHTIAWQAVATAGFWWSGAVHGVTGTVGVALTALSWVGLANLAVQAQQAGAITDAALDRGLGPDWRARRNERTRSRGARARDRLQLVFPLWLRDRRIERLRDIDYGQDGTRAHRLDIYRSRERTESGPAPVFVYVHGGGWVIGDKREQGLPAMLFLANQGWVCLTINYRLSPRATWPDHLVDVKRALAWAHEHVSEYGGDPSFVALAGGSAGGHLASLAALTPEDDRYQPGFETKRTDVDACVSFYGVYDLTNRDGLRRGQGFRRVIERVIMKRSLEEAPELYREASPMDCVNPDAPPFMVIHGSNDSLVPVAEARDFVRRLRQCGSRAVIYAELPGAQHAFEVFRSIRTGHVVSAMTDFLSYVRGLKDSGPGPQPASVSARGGRAGGSGPGESNGPSGTGASCSDATGLPRGQFGLR